MVQRSQSRSQSSDPVQRPPMPLPVRNAVWLIYAGAAISAITLILFFTISIGGLKSAIRIDFPHYTAAQVNQAYSQIIAQQIIQAGIGILLWLAMAWANSKGLGWARIASSVFFAFNTYGLFSSFQLHVPALDLAFVVVTWLVGLGAIVLLWRKESTAYFYPARA